MKYGYSLLSKGLFILLAYLVISCDDEESLPSTELLISVLIEDSIPAVNAEVSIYRTLADFQDEESPVRSVQTDEDGKVTIYGLAPDQLYFVDVRRFNQTNWISNMNTPKIELGQNEFKTTINTNWYSNLALQSGKSWSPKYASVGVYWHEYASCFSNDVYRFYKNFKLVYSNNGQCNPNELAGFRGVWAGFVNQVSIYPEDETLGQLSFKLLESTPDYFIGQFRSEDGSFIRVRFEQ